MTAPFSIRDGAQPGAGEVPPAPAEAPGAGADLAWRRLGPADLDAVDRLHRRALGGAGPDVVKPETADFFARLLGGGGGGIGAFTDGRLIAYGLIQRDLPSYDDPRPLVGASLEVPVVKLSGASVDPAHRGRGLQRALIAARVALARADAGGALPLLFATCAPANVPSCANLLAQRFAVRAVKLYYGGHPRYVMVREGDGPLPEGRAGRLTADLREQTGLLALGWRGVGLEDGAGGPCLRLAPPANRAP